ncbi:MAG: response regulator transcription factor [Acidobacteriia bacterium]|nr:response regulator transcription factor [Terriglobia bacterium]
MNPARAQIPEISRPVDRLRGISRHGARQSQAGSNERESATLPQEAAASQCEALTVFVADQHPVVREGLVALINRQADMRVVGEASNGREAVEQFIAQRPSMAFLALRMPVMDGVDAVQAIREKVPTARLVIFTSYQVEEAIYRALQAGASGYVLKDTPPEDLIECIRTVSNGGTWISPAVAAKLAKRVAARDLTPREMEVLRLVARGKSNKEVGVALNISEATVKVHMTHILEKLKVTGRTEAIGVAVKRGLVDLEAVAAA